MNKREKDQYYFSVEGQTEKWYLDWLQAAINSNKEAKRLVSIVAKAAVARADKIAASNETDVGKTTCQHCGYTYYCENPVTDLWIWIDEIITQAGL